ncbi:MAG: phosphatase PAP2 family protein [Lapillicoccus sp.]
MSGWRSALTSRDAPVSDPPRWRRLLPALGYAAGVAVPVTGLALLVRARVDGVLPVDQALIDAATAVTRADPGLRGVLLAWQEVFQPRWVYLAGAGVAVWVWRRHGLTGRALWGFVTMMAAWNLALDLKYVVQRARPVVLDPVSHAPGYSFPSGHAANVAAAGTVVTVMLWPVLRSRAARTATVVAAATVVTVTALDRVLLGVHFPTDVAAGVLLGSGLALASYAGYRGWHPVHPAAHPGRSGPLRHTPKEV